MNDSSTNQLLECLEILANTKENESEIILPSQIAYNIGEKIEPIDSDLYYQWMKAKEFYQNIEEDIEEILKNIYDSILSYSEENLMLEEDSVKIVNYANEAADEILKDLEL